MTTVNGSPISTKVGAAARAGNAFAKGTEATADWVGSQKSIADLRAGRLPLPTVAKWSELTAVVRPPLPPIQLLVNNLRREHPTRTDEQLLGTAIWRAIAALVPPVDATYTRRQLDPENTLLPRFRFVAQRPDALPVLPVGRTQTEYALHIGTSIVGAATLNFLDRPGVHQSWLGAVRFEPGAVPANGATAVYAGAAEQAHREAYTLRTTPSGVMGPGSAKLWQNFIDAGIATVVTPLTPVDDGTKHTGHAYIAPRTI